MDTIHIQNILKNKAFPDVGGEVRLIETHISWVILTQNFAYKIKKPMRYSFLDFSTLGKRKFYCERELELNQRLAENMYLSVVPIRRGKKGAVIEGTDGEVMDYAVKMKRMDESRQMNILLENSEVKTEHIYNIAEKLSTFHAFTDNIETPIKISTMAEDFADILKVKRFIGKNLGQNVADKIDQSVVFSNAFLKKYAERIKERHAQGFTIDGHGDLHSKNIFLLDESEGYQSVIFDCIEFNDHFRQVDVLSELAFFCMDLDFYGKEDLEMLFLQNYLLKYPCIFNEADRQIFQYYKLYRANVRVKINALKAMQTMDEKELKKRMELVEDYFLLMKRYLVDLENKALETSKSITQ